MTKPTEPAATLPAEGVHVVSYSELDTFRQCPLKHRLAYQQRWSKPRDQASPALRRGTLWHAVMELHYKTLMKTQTELGRRVHSGDEEVEALIRCAGEIRAAGILADPDTGTQTAEQALVQWMYEGYLECWGADRDWLVVSVETKYEVPLPVDLQGTESDRFRIKMTVDLLVKDRRGKVWVVDHKTCADLPDGKVLDIDDQFGLYTWGLRTLGIPVEGSMHNAARTRRNKTPMELNTRFRRTPMYRTDKELATLALDAHTTAANAWRQVTGPVQSSPNPMMCRFRCDFLDAHLLMRKGAGTPAQLLPSMGFEQNFHRH